ncbi:MAG: InlB B-repeat-containing protein, partial [Planctomycetota bacterium]
MPLSAAGPVLSVSSTSGGSVTDPGEGSFQYDDGTVVSIRAAAANNYYFVNWTGTAVSAGKVANPNDAVTTLTVDSGYTLRANFAEIAVPNRAPVLSSIGNKSVQENATLSFTVSATDADGDPLAYSAQNLPGGATFSSRTFRWTPSTAQAGTYQVIFTVSDGQATDSETVTITVTNLPDPSQTYTLTVNVSGAGSVTASPNKSVYDDGEIVTLQAVADAGYTFAGWSGDVSGGANPLSIVMDSDKSVSAGFVTYTPKKLPISAGDTWRYFKGTVEPPANWNDLGFDDSSWLLGPTGIGYSSDVSYPTVL